MKYRRQGRKPKFPRRLPDEGCEFATSCFECPLPKCKDEFPGGATQARAWLRNQEIERDWRTGPTVRELSRKYNLDRRSIYRILAHRTGGYR